MSDSTQGGAASVASPSGVGRSGGEPWTEPTAACRRHREHDRLCPHCLDAAAEQSARIADTIRGGRQAVEPGEDIPLPPEPEPEYALPDDRNRDAMGTHPGTHRDAIRARNGTRPTPEPRTRPDSENRRSEHAEQNREKKVRPGSHAENPGRTRTHPGTHPGEDDSPADRRPRYPDIAAMLAGTLPEPPTPTVCPRSDGVGLFYREQYNSVIGDPESGKTLLTDHASVSELANGGRVLRIDMDHNGIQSTISRLLDMGAGPEVLGDSERFLYIEPEDRLELIQVVDHMKAWRPTLVVLDSIGELLPMFGHNSNSADDFTVCHSAVIKPLVRTGACVIGIDHLSKGSDSRAYGAGGTMAKKRALGGTAIRVTVDVAFTPGKGGSAYLSINKDRHGGLRAKSPVGDKEPSAGKFVLWPDENGGSGVRAIVKAPAGDERNPAEAATPDDIAEVRALRPPPTSANDAQKRLQWRAARARAAYKAWKLSPADTGSREQ